MELNLEKRQVWSDQGCKGKFWVWGCIPCPVAEVCHKNTAMQFASAANADDEARRKIKQYKADR